jgi:hypothetical protein
VTDVRSFVFSRFDRDRIYHRQRPARRIAEGFSLLFLLSLAAIATLTTAPAGHSEHRAAPFAAGTSAQDSSNSR